MSRANLRILVSAALLHAVLIGGGYMSLPPLFDRMMKAVDWTLSDLQQTWALIPLGSGIAAIWAGRALHNHSDFKIIICAGAVTAFSIGSRGFVSDIVQLAIALLIFGAASGTLLVVLTHRVSQTFLSEDSGVAQAVFFGAYTIGAAISLATAESIAEWLGGWRRVFWFWSIASVAALGVVIINPRISEAEFAASKSRAVSLQWLRAVTPFALVYAGYVGGYLALIGLLPAQLRAWSWPPQSADFAIAVSTITFIAGALMWGAVADRYGRERLLFTASMIGLGVAVVILSLVAKDGISTTGFIAASSIGLFSGAMALYFPILLAATMTGGPRAAMSIGHTTAASYAGGFFIPFSLADVSSTYPISAIWICAGIFILAGFTMAFATR